MKARSTVMLALGLLAATLAAPAASGAAGAKLDNDLFGPNTSGRAIIGFTHDIDQSTITRLSRAGITRAVVIEMIDAVGVLGPIDSYRAIAGWRDVAYVDADTRLRFENFGAKADTKVVDVRGGKKPLARKYDGSGVTVAVMDTGIDNNHPDLQDRIVKNLSFEPGWFMDMLEDGVYSDQLSEATGTPLDTGGHGTHVAGTVAGTGVAGMGEDFSGVAPGASIVNLKIAEAHQGPGCQVDVMCDIGWEMNALVGYEYAIEHRADPVYPGGIRVINNSWSTAEVDSDIEPITLIVQAAFRKGIVSVFAAGNAGDGRDTVALGPNRAEEVITVGATCKTAKYTTTARCAPGQIASFSSRGRAVDVSAPGVGIWSTSALGFGNGTTAAPPADDRQASANNTVYYVAYSGTSMATPHVSGIVALMLQASPRLTPGEVERLLIRTSTDKGKKGFDNDYGFGFVNAQKAVAAGIALKAPKKRL